MEDDIVKRMREQERLLGEMRNNLLGWMDDLLRNAFNPETFLGNTAGIGQSDNFDPYRVLGLEKTATDGEIKKRYRELLMKLHPDTAGVKGTEFIVQILNTAYRQIARERGWNQ